MISLQKLCFNLIVQEFEKFHFLFTVSKDDNLKRDFEFLQITYSLELISELHKRKQLRKEYMPFLINRHLEFLDGNWITDEFRSSLLISIEDTFYRLPNLRRISICETCCDEILVNIAKFCPKISEIDARHSGVSDNGIKYLCKDENGKVPCPELKKIFIEGSGVTVEGLKYLLSNLPSLEIIDRPNFPLKLNRQRVKDLCNFENARSYNLIGIDLVYAHSNEIPYYADFLKLCLTVCTTLKSIACCISDERELLLFTKFCLEKFHLRCLREHPKINLCNFLKYKGFNLTCLRVQGCVIPISDLSKYCPKLEQLCIANVTFSEFDGSSQPIFHCLTKCFFQETGNDPSTNRAMRYLLLSSPKLESLFFQWCDLSFPINSYILKCCKNCLIKELTLACRCAETVDLVKDILLNCSSLMTLSPGSYDLNYNVIEPLSDIIKKLPNKPYYDMPEFYFDDVGGYLTFDLKLR